MTAKEFKSNNSQPTKKRTNPPNTNNKKINPPNTKKQIRNKISKRKNLNIPPKNLNTFRSTKIAIQKNRITQKRKKMPLLSRNQESNSRKNTLRRKLN